MRRISLAALAVVALLAFAACISADVDPTARAAPASSAVLSKPVLRVGVIGSGITGASTAYFLHSLLHDLVDLRFTVWECDHRVGGRIADVHLGGFRMEGGGSILHDSNRYMREFAAKLNLSLHEPPPKLDSSTAVWNGAEFLLRLGGAPEGWLGKLRDGLAIVWRYGLDFLRLEQIVRGVATAFSSIYAMQDKRESFDSPRAMLQAMGLWEHTQYGFHEWLHQQRTWITGCDRHTQHPSSSSSAHHPEAILHELAVAATRINYNQDLDLNAMAGAVGLIPLTNPKMWSVQGGNAQVPRGLFQLVDADVKLGHTVRVVTRGSDAEGEITVQGIRLSRKDQQQQQLPADATFSDRVDLLIVATPLELAQGIEFKIAAAAKRSNTAEAARSDAIPTAAAAADELLPVPAAGLAYPRSFVSTHATFLSARLRPEPFGLSSASDLPATILTTEVSPDLVPFTSIAAYAEEERTGRRYYKVFSRAALDAITIDELFEDVDPTLPPLRLHWKAYPRFAPPERFRPAFEIYPNIWDPTALEPAASAMEVCAIAARNVALAIANRARDKIKRERIIMDEEHDEL